jgi:hypothetical protein
MQGKRQVSGAQTQSLQTNKKEKTNKGKGRRKPRKAGEKKEEGRDHKPPQLRQ